MVIDRRLVDLGVGDDGANAGALVALARKRASGRFDNLLPRCLRDAGHFFRPRHGALQFKRAFEPSARSWPRQAPRTTTFKQGMWVRSAHPCTPRRRLKQVEIFPLLPLGHLGAVARDLGVLDA